MKKWWMIWSVMLYLFGCGTTNSLTKTPQQDKSLYEVISKLAKNPGDIEAARSFESAYAEAVLNHQKNITNARNGNQPDKWERIMYEYSFLNKIADAVQAVPSAAKVVSTQRYDEQLAEAKQNALENYYDDANDLLKQNDKDAARQAYTLLQKVNKLSPNYKDTKRLLDIAERNSVLNVIVIPVNYYSQNYGYWGLNNDYVQQEIVRDLRFQLGSGTVKVFTEQEARANRIDPDRIIELRWDELFMPQPYTQTFTRELSKQIETGRTKDNQPIYATVSAVLYVTRQEVRASGNLSCRITNANGETLLLDYFPSNYSWVREHATYRGDSRALGSYEWALINNSRLNAYSRRDVFAEVFQQVHSQLISRIRSLNW